MSENAPATDAYSKHVQDAGNRPSTSGVQISWTARLAIFIVFPLTMGLLGLYMGYLETLRKPDRKLSIENDFIMPFLLALAFTIVVGFQTKGYSTSKIEPLVKWPKVVRKKVIKKVRKEDLDEGDEIVEEEVEEKDPTTKKDD